MSQYNQSVHYTHPLVTWGPTLLGTAVAIVTAVMLNALGASLGFATATNLQTHTSAATTGIVGIAWVVVSNLIAVGFGAWIAARSTANPDHHRGTLQGIAVWAVTSLAIVYLAGSALAGATSTFLQSAGAASSVSIAREADRGTLQNRAETAADEAQATVNRNEAEIRDTAEKTAAVSSVAALGTFLSMLFGLFAAVVGARIGARHPQWDNRPHYAYTDKQNPTTPTNLRNAA